MGFLLSIVPFASRALKDIAEDPPLSCVPSYSNEALGRNNEGEPLFWLMVSEAEHHSRSLWQRLPIPWDGIHSLQETAERKGSHTRQSCLTFDLLPPAFPAVSQNSATRYRKSMWMEQHIQTITTDVSVNSDNIPGSFLLLSPF